MTEAPLFSLKDVVCDWEAQVEFTETHLKTEDLKSDLLLARSGHWYETESDSEVFSMKQHLAILETWEYNLK